MFTFEEKKDYFIRECKSKKYLMKKLADLNDELNLLAESMKSGYAYDNGEKMNCEDVLVKERERINERINCIDDTIARIRNAQVRGIITDLWINNHSKTRVSHDYSFCEQHIYKKAKKELRKVL